MKGCRWVVAGLAGPGLAIGVTSWAGLSAGQLPLAPIRDSGQTVTPVYEGWYRNTDGTYNLSFGYFNRNAKEGIDIPVGPNNFIEPGAQNQGQPTRFEPRRHWGVFTVTASPDFGDRKVVWTLVVRGQTFSIPGHLHRDWQIDALRDGASGNTPPALKFDLAGPEGRGPRGVTGTPLTTSVGRPLTLTVWATDDGVRRAGSRPEEAKEPPVTLTWLQHQGPGTVTFSEVSPKADEAAQGRTTTQATFSAPGEYLLRVRANDATGIVSGGHAQCCWTNGFVKVTVAQ